MIYGECHSWLLTDTPQYLSTPDFDGASSEIGIGI